MDEMTWLPPALDRVDDSIRDQILEDSRLCDRIARRAAAEASE